MNNKDIIALTSREKIFKNIFDQYGCPPKFQRSPGFESLCNIILEQQVSLQSAEAHFSQLKNYIKVISATNILRLSAEEMRSCYVSKQKAIYLKALSAAVIAEEINFEQHEKMKALDVRQQLLAVKGIGEWTADIYMMMCLQHKDIFPIGDIAVYNTCKKLFRIDDKISIVTQSEQWKPYRSLATIFLWHQYLSEKKK